MIEASLVWTDKDRFVGSATSRHSIVMDAAAEKTANSPMELVLLALCGCTASDVVGILRKKREPFTGLEVTAKAERADGYPAVYTSIHLTYLIRGQVSQKAAQDAVRLSKEKYCSVSAMLEKTAKITYTIEHLP
jgi:putative redox protein